MKCFLNFFPDTEKIYSFTLQNTSETSKPLQAFIILLCSVLKTVFKQKGLEQISRVFKIGSAVFLNKIQLFLSAIDDLLFLFIF